MAGDLDPRRYNAPTASEVAVIIPEQDDIPANSRQIIVHGYDNFPTLINDTSPYFEPWHFVFPFSTGQLGWHDQIPLVTPDGSERNVTLMRYAQFHMNRRPDDFDFNTLIRCGKVFQVCYHTVLCSTIWVHTLNGRISHSMTYSKQCCWLLSCLTKFVTSVMQEWLVDTYARVDSMRLHYLSTHQKELRADLYQNLANASAAGGSTQGRQHGRRVVLPSSYTGGTRYQNQLFQVRSSTIAPRLRC